MRLNRNNKDSLYRTLFVVRANNIYKKPIYKTYISHDRHSLLIIVKTFNL
jgi:hypothetical protein